MLGVMVLAVSANIANPLLTFSREPSFDPRPVTVEVGVLGNGPMSEVWFRRTVGRPRGARTVSWTDTVRCPAARAALHEARRLEMPRVSVPGLENDEIIITADGVRYRLTGMADYPGESSYRFQIMSNLDTPLARWVDESLRVLETRWTNEAPDAR